MKNTVLFLLAAFVGRGAAPIVTRVEPPDWPAPANAVTLRLLLTGQNLAGARVSGCDAAQVTGSAQVSASGTHLFVDLAIGAGAQPGACTLRVTNPDGAAAAPFTIAAPLDSKGRFQGFSSDDVIYLIMPDRFANGDPSNDDPALSPGLFDRSKPRYYHGGDLAGIEKHLSYLNELGISAVWLTPVYDNSNRLNERERYGDKPVTDYHGYGAVDFYGVDEHLGTLDGLRRLVDAAHARYLEVILDNVCNHTGPYHPWVQDPPTATWFHGTEAAHPAETWQIQTLLDPHATPEMKRGTLDGWFVNILPDLNQDDPEVTRYLVQNTVWWVGTTGADGIREDTVPYVPRTFWRDWMSGIHAAWPHVPVVGEVFDGDPALTSFYQGGRAGFDGVDTGMDTVFDFPLFYAIRNTFAHHGSPGDLAHVIGHDGLYPNAARLVTFLGNHDVPRFLNEEGATIEDLKRAFTFLFSVRGTPLVYYGDEIGMRGGPDPDNRHDFPGGWAGDSHNAFEEGGRTADENSVFNQVRSLAALRRRHPALRHGSMIDLLLSDHAYAFARTAEDDHSITVVHEGPAAETLRVPVAGTGLRDGARLRSASGRSATVADGVVEIRLQPRSTELFVTEP
jgi:glycosidase